jgi:hypothetical protein
MRLGLTRKCPEVKRRWLLLHRQPNWLAKMNIVHDLGAIDDDGAATIPCRWRGEDTVSASPACNSGERSPTPATTRETGEIENDHRH